MAIVKANNRKITRKGRILIRKRIETKHPEGRKTVKKDVYVSIAGFIFRTRITREQHPRTANSANLIRPTWSLGFHIHSPMSFQKVREGFKQLAIPFSRLGGRRLAPTFKKAPPKVVRPRIPVKIPYSPVGTIELINYPANSTSETGFELEQMDFVSTELNHILERGRNELEKFLKPFGLNLISARSFKFAVKIKHRWGRGYKVNSLCDAIEILLDRLNTLEYMLNKLDDYSRSAPRGNLPSPLKQANRIDAQLKVLKKWQILLNNGSFSVAA